MIIPLRTNRPPKRRPVVTEALLVLNLLVFLTGLILERTSGADADPLRFGYLWREDFHVFQLLTYQFLHDQSSIWHLAFNMLFFWIFGRSVEDRLSRLSFLMFYLIGGVVAGLAHMMISPNPVLGASGAVAGVTGAFLAFYPRARIQVLFFLIFIGVFSIPALWFIGFFFVLDVLRQTGSLLGGSGGGVAYMAHIAGYLYGFGLGFTLLAMKILPREEFDVFFLFKQWRRRAAFRAAGKQQVGGMWESGSADTGAQLAKQRKKESPKLVAVSDAHAERRSRIRQLAGAHKHDEACAEYAKLLADDPASVFDPVTQVDLANQFHAEGRYELAAQAYELLLRGRAAPSAHADVKLLLGLIYVRHMAQPARAKELIEAARPHLQDAGQKALADELLADLGGISA